MRFAAEGVPHRERELFGAAGGVATGIFRDDIEPHDLLRALAGVAHVRPSENWKRSAVRMVDLLLKGMQSTRLG
jgi:hypothetical protein